MKPGMEVGLDPCHIVLDGDPALPLQKRALPFPSLRRLSMPKSLTQHVLSCRFCSHSAMLTKVNDDGVECEKVDVVQIKTVPKFMSVMSIKFV